MKNITTFDFKELNKFKEIYVLVSGGFDSVYLYEIIKNLFPKKTFPLNCYNPYEWNKTLKQIEENDENFIKIKPGNYKDVIKNSFLKLPQAYELKREKKYHKKIFPCCRVLKHKEFFKDDRFKENNTVIISGIKRGDSHQRGIWLTQLSQGKEPCNQSNGEPTFYHKHKGGQLYCYPFRDYMVRELLDNIKNKLWKKYPYLEHSGCSLCPVLVLFKIVSEGKRYERSVQYARNLNVFHYRDILN